MNYQKETFEISYSFPADLKTVFEMWTNPNNFSKWLGPDGAVMSFMTTNVKEGGTSQWAMTMNDELTKYGQLSYKIIKANSLLVYAQNFCDKDGNFIKAPFSDTYPDYLLTTVSFAKDKQNQTKVSVKWEIFGEASEIERQTFQEMKEIMKIGWTASFHQI